MLNHSAACAACWRRRGSWRRAAGKQAVVRAAVSYHLKVLAHPAVAHHGSCTQAGARERQQAVTRQVRNQAPVQLAVGRANPRGKLLPHMATLPARCCCRHREHLPHLPVLPHTSYHLPVWKVWWSSRA